ncbi:MAG: 16S rRNA (cytidine(1402)-2'-O)-methyltransferase [Candidatus Omnitrophica bacterium]|nr:16S rRNA (cytidine(1402)-2'-O)-methyltransferase [Candidatus Omnitrophota bacterium]MBU4479049.1 16S rRNA (cytidine(1402)-2'-O)-methyltransferase [Candidatus Omnitrophota bacterium]MCG2702756.1 16S rRNA (cytidine(1402)-2'-O)-methyltransferase [Candidatus Omnitrophota bacterium]
MLYIVATPIGNLKDITLRAIEVLSKVDFIACEDTRRTHILLQHYDIKKPLLSYYEYNKLKRIDEIIRALKENKNVALVSDAGTPGISDPGSSLIRRVIGENLKIEVIPGASALLVGLVLSGLPMHKFIFEGFLPVKAGARRRALECFKDEHRTVIFYESPHRLLKTLVEIKEVLGNCNIVIARELTKKFEEVLRFKAEEAIVHFTRNEPRGEFVILIHSNMKGE